MRRICGRKIRIRRCTGNQDAWLLVVMRGGKESEAYASYTTAMSLDALLATAGHLTPVEGDVVELIPYR